MILCLSLAAGFAALGVWQVERLGWKRDLIDTVNARLVAPPVSPPSGSDWSPDWAYTRVSVDGVLLYDKSVPVQALTERGAGWWLMTPLRTGTGIILVNRGFVPTKDWRDADTTPKRVSVTGLMRADEPGGGFLRANAPADGRWYSRDIKAIAQAGGLGGSVAPYFIDAAASGAGTYPIGGMTVVRFSNNHLSYALTWFALCGLSLAGAGTVLRHGRRR